MLAGTFRGQNGVLLFRPVYRYGSRVETAEERRRSLVGFTFCVFVVRELVDNVLRRIGSTGVRVAIYDDSALAVEPFLAVWPDLAPEEPAAVVAAQAAAPRLESSAKSKWAAAAGAPCSRRRAGAFGDVASWQSWVVPGVGVLFSLLLAVYFETARRQAVRMREQAITDPLTGLYNRRYLWDFLERECLRARRSGAKIAAVMIDVDRFKSVNDTHGHELATASSWNSLRCFARACAAPTSPAATAARNSS